MALRLEYASQMVATILQTIRPLIHPIVVHFPIALLFVSVALDWTGYILGHLNLTRAGFYTLVLGTAGAGVAALTGPDHVSGDASVVALLTQHQAFALVTVAIALALVWVRFLAADGIHGKWAAVYLACTVALLVAVSMTGYFGGELTYHQGVGVMSTQAGAAAGVSEIGGEAGSQVPTKPLVALLGLLTIIGLGVWVTAGRKLVGAYYQVWWRAVRREYGNSGSSVWTVRRGARSSHASAYVPSGLSSAQRDRPGSEVVGPSRLRG